jgi:ABC-type glutathione transport system ATPase component
MVPLVTMSGITKDYRLGATVVPALRGVDLTLQAGEFTAVWGPSGSGKTTLLNLIGTIDLPSSGRLCIQGKDVGDLSDNARAELRNHFIGFVFHGFNLIPVLSALENVMLPLQSKGVGSAVARQAAVQRLAEVGLSGFVKLDAYDYQRYGTVAGTVVFLSLDLGVGGGQRTAVYLVKIALDGTEVGRGELRGQVKLGMTGQADIVTGQECLLTLLVKGLRLTISLG